MRPGFYLARVLQCRGGTQHQVVRAAIGKPRCKRTRDGKGKIFRRLNNQTISGFSEDDQALKQMVSVIPTPRHMEEQIYFCRRCQRKSRCSGQNGTPIIGHAGLSYPYRQIWHHQVRAEFFLQSPVSDPLQA